MKSPLYIGCRSGSRLGKREAHEMLSRFLESGVATVDSGFGEHVAHLANHCLENRLPFNMHFHRDGSTTLRRGTTCP